MCVGGGVYVCVRGECARGRARARVCVCVWVGVGGGGCLCMYVCWGGGGGRELGGWGRGDFLKLCLIPNVGLSSSTLAVWS